MAYNTRTISPVFRRHSATEEKGQPLCPALAIVAGTRAEIENLYVCIENI